jgi:hypothetical protein
MFGDQWITNKVPLTFSFPRSVKLTTHLYLVPKSNMRGDLPPCPFMARCVGSEATLPLYIILFLWFSSVSRQLSEYYLEIGHGHFFLDHFRFIIPKSSYHLTLYNQRRWKLSLNNLLIKKQVRVFSQDSFRYSDLCPNLGFSVNLCSMKFLILYPPHRRRHNYVTKTGSTAKCSISWIWFWYHELVMSGDVGVCTVGFLLWYLCTSCSLSSGSFTGHWALSTQLGVALLPFCVIMTPVTKLKILEYKQEHLLPLIS